MAETTAWQQFGKQRSELRSGWRVSAEASQRRVSAYVGRRVGADNTVSQSFDRHQRRARLPMIRFHGLRHTHATLALAAGVHPKVVQERLGHSSITVTLDTYSHAVPAMQAEAASRIAALIDT